MKQRSSIFSDFLGALGVKHTAGFSDRQFANMNFKSLFGLSRLLSSYNIPNAAFRLSSSQQLLDMPTPFLAQKDHSFVVVTDIFTGKNGKMVKWEDSKAVYQAPGSDFIKDCSGVVLQAYPDEKSAEPDYKRHHLLELADEAKRWVLVVAGILLFLWGFISNGLYRNLSTTLLSIVDIAGLGVTWLLLLKSLKVKSAAADSVCGVLQRHGCDHVLEDKASSFFGIFSWSEVGFAYFSISLATLLLFPAMIGVLALVNACCLPFTIWSIWYQKFKIHTWCTLCVITQCLLWCQFLCYLLGGWWSFTFPLSLGIIPLLFAYAGTMLAINAICNFIKNRS